MSYRDFMCSAYIHFSFPQLVSSCGINHVFSLKQLREWSPLFSQLFQVTVLHCTVMAFAIVCCSFPVRVYKYPRWPGLVIHSTVIDTRRKVRIYHQVLIFTNTTVFEYLHFDKRDSKLKWWHTNCEKEKPSSKIPPGRSTPESWSSSKWSSRWSSTQPRSQFNRVITTQLSRVCSFLFSIS